MSFIDQPFYDGLAAYRPIKFSTIITLDNAAYINPIAYVNVYKNAVLLVENIPYTFAFSEVSFLPFETDYTFYIDIQKYCQDSLAPTKSLTSNFSPNGSVVAINTDCYADYYIQITYYALDVPTNLLKVASGVSIDTSNTYTVTCASLQHLQQMNLIQYYGTLGFQNGVFLTKSARNLNVVDSDNQYLTMLTPFNITSSNTFQIQMFDSSNVLVEEGLYRYTSTSFIQQLSLNVGFDSLSAITYTQGSPNFANPNIAYYTISFGTSTLVGIVYIYARHTEEFTYNRVGLCGESRALRFHWLNLLGGVDSYTFDSEKSLLISTDYTSALGSLSWDAGKAIPDSKQDVGAFKYNSQASSRYDVVSKILTNEQSIWLSELFMSTKVYIELNGVFVPVVIDKKTSQISRHQGKIRIQVTAFLSNDYIIPRI